MADLIDCSTCRFFKKRSADQHGIYGECRRYPPVLSPLSVEDANVREYDDNGIFIGRYEHDFVSWCQPAVTDEDWCGEHQSLDASS